MPQLPRSTLINEEIIKSIILNSSGPFTAKEGREERWGEREREEKKQTFLIDELDLLFPDNKFHLFYKNYAQVTLFDGIFITCRVNKSNLCCLILSVDYKSRLVSYITTPALMRGVRARPADWVVKAAVTKQQFTAETHSLSVVLYSREQIDADDKWW